MAEWDTNVYENTKTYEHINHSRQNSHSSGYSVSSKENTNDSTTDEPAPRILILREGDDLTGESGTERSNSVYNNDRLTPAIPVRQPITPGAGAGTAKAKAAKSPYTSPPVECVPVETISIPNDGNISVFTSIQLANFLRCLKIDEKIISHLHRKAVDGNRFGKMTDTELDTLGMNNPVIVFFRNKSSPKSKKKDISCCKEKVYESYGFTNTQSNYNQISGGS